MGQSKHLLLGFSVSDWFRLSSFTFLTLGIKDRGRINFSRGRSSLPDNPFDASHFLSHVSK